MPAHETMRAENQGNPNPPKPDAAEQPAEQPQARPAPVHTDTQLAGPTEPATPTQPA